MSWAKLDDHFPTHPKMVKAGGDAGWLHVCALCYCAEHLTDGLVPKELVPRLSDRKKPMALAAWLVECGVWIDRGDSFELHDYLDWNPSAEHVQRERDAARERRARHGQTGGRTSSERRANVARTSDDARANVSSPVPVPVPDTPNGVLGAPAKRRKSAHPIPDDWTPSQKTRDWARAEYPAQATKGVLESFRDHAQATDRRQVDWDKAFRLWIRNEAKWHPAPAVRAEKSGPARTHL